MESNKENYDMFKELDTLDKLLDVDNVEAIIPDDNDIISVGEESVIEECLNDTDGSLSSVNLDFFNDDSRTPIIGRRKKTMEKRKEERMSFRHVVAEATASDKEDDEDFSSMSSFSSMDSDLERIQLKDSVPSTSKNSDCTNTVNDKQIIDCDRLQEMIRIFSEYGKSFKKKFPTLFPSKEDNLCNLKKTVRIPKNDKERKSKPDEVYVKFREKLEQERIRFQINENISKMIELRRKIRLLQSKSVEELRRNNEENKSETDKEITVNDVTNEALKQELSNIDFKIPSTNKNRNVSKADRRKRILLSPKRGRDEKSVSGNEFQNMEIANQAIDDVETPSTSKAMYPNVPKIRVGGLKRIPLPKSDEEEEEWNNDDMVPASSKNLNVAKKKVVRRKRRVSTKRQEVANNAHVYSFFSSMADLVSTLPYSTTMTAKARVTKMLEEMVERLEKNSRHKSPLKPMESHEISLEDLILIKLRLSRLHYIS